MDYKRAEIELKIVALAADDHDLEVHQDFEDPWIDQVIRDLERLAGRVS